MDFLFLLEWIIFLLEDFEVIFSIFETDFLDPILFTVEVFLNVDVFFDPVLKPDDDLSNVSSGTVLLIVETLLNFFNVRFGDVL